ncbi:MAG: Gfo/Idh/MocA family oxidoreductase [Bryobacteraceae bacterium]|nr:Gfo/Idh/MocA family oxidoreductase [Bryobacteraceae bacterium]
MLEPLKIAVAGLGRMGWIHAQHVGELAKETGACQLVAVADASAERRQKFIDAHGASVPVLSSVDELAEAKLCHATVVVTPTEKHREHATRLIRAGHRVLVEKPLTGQLAGDREFAAELDAHHPQALMLAFQRRFDEALSFARELMQSGAIGPVFKIYSALEDSGPAPNGYQSDGILSDMSIHNVDEILWLTGQLPEAALAVGSRTYSHRLTTCTEDFDDAVLFMWFPKQAVGELTAQVQVTRNHVSGYRVESAIFGEKGHIRLGRFAQRPHEVIVEAYGPRFQPDPLVQRIFAVLPDQPGQAEFVARFGKSYKAEVAAFVECCRAGTPFPITHRDGLRAQEVIAAGMRKMLTCADGSRIGS